VAIRDEAGLQVASDSIQYLEPEDRPVRFSWCGRSMDQWRVA